MNDALMNDAPRPPEKHRDSVKLVST
jgi:hypothetical protein